MTACPRPNAYTLALPRRMRCSPTVGPSTLTASSPASSGPGHRRLTGRCLTAETDAGQEGEHEVELLLNRQTVRGTTRYLVLWRWHVSADDEWLRLEELALCPEKVEEYGAASPRCSLARQPGPAAWPAVPPMPPRPLRRWWHQGGFG